VILDGDGDEWGRYNGDVIDDEDNFAQREEAA
jgi:hypothetical protein